MATVIPQTPFLASIAALSVTLAGFSGLVSAFRRGAQWSPIDVYRLRQIPEMGLATALIALSTLPLADTTGSDAGAIRIASTLALAFTTGHVAVLLRRTRGEVDLPRAAFVWAAVIDCFILVTALGGILLGITAAYEWLLVSMLARPMLAFVMVLTDVSRA